MANKKDIIIVGGGIVGVSTAYYLALRGFTSTIVEKTGIASSASGKAGGFLARGWGSGTTKAIHEEGFKVHEQLATDLNIQSFRYLKTVSVAKSRRSNNNGEGNSLLDPEATKVSLMDPSTAQVTPLELVRKMLEKAQSLGVTVKKGKVVGLQREENGKYSAVKMENGEKVKGDVIVLAMGAWGVETEDWFDSFRVPMVGIASSSMIVKATASITDAPACFCSEDSNGCHLEMYPRPDNTVYVCGFGGSPHLKKEEVLKLNPDEIKPNQNRVLKAIDSFRHLSKLKSISVSESSNEADLTLQCCLRPCTSDSLPMIGKLPGVDIYIAHGHNCWGILWGPITGKVMSELILDGTTSLDLKSFDPMRFS
mmetsp:Transcript_20284/g.26328  ORF Transcript_20284/g.26328 Transcript_20284/m.26328 type:complete len:367 (+) Transcript_20284:47-1147(+)